MSRSAVILMIEDDADIRELLAGRVRRLGVEVETATTGAAGIEKARQLLPSLVIIDIGLPDIDGWKVIDTLAEDELTRDIPVVVASVTDPRDENPLGVTAHLVKPIKKGDLEEAVIRTLEQVD
mgnify:CR=1 FL=1